MDIGKLLAGLGIDQGKPDSDMLRQAESMWKMLDDLADSNPEGYQQFVSSNISQGKEAIEKEREAETQAFTRKLAKDDFVATLKVDFLLKPKIAEEDLKAPKSVVIDKRVLTTYRGSLLLSIFAVKDQNQGLPPSIDKITFRFDKKNEVCCSVCAALSPSNARGLLSIPMTEEARRDLSATLSKFHTLFPREAKKHILLKKLELDYDPRLHIFELLPSTLGKLQTYLDCDGKTSPPSSIILESLIEDQKLKKTPETKTPPPKPEVVFKSPAEQAPAPTKPEVPVKPKPKIEVIAEATDYEAMVVEKKVTQELIEIGIELDTVDSMAEVDLDISKLEIRILKRSLSK